MEADNPYRPPDSSDPVSLSDLADEALTYLSYALRAAFVISLSLFGAFGWILLAVILIEAIGMG